MVSCLSFLAKPNWSILFFPLAAIANCNTTLTGLRPNTYYRVALKSRCDNFGWTDYTEWVVFRTDECAKPENIVEQALGRSTMQLSWDASYGTNAYELRYKLNDTPGADWITNLTADSFYVIENLLSNQIYDYQISERCQGDTGIKRSPQDTFLTRRPSLNNGFYVCGVPGDADLSNQTPLAELLTGDTIMAFDFPVVIKAAEGGNGYFRGQGDIELPYFNKAKFSFVFDNIFVNDEYRMVGGYLEATGFGAEILPPWADSLLANVIAVLEELDEYLGEQQQQLLQDLIQLGANGDLPPALQADLQAVLDCFAAAQTSEEIAACNQQMQVVMQQVNQFLEELYNGDFQLVFRKNSEQYYGFDAKEGTAPDDWYESRAISGEDYWIPYKSVRAGLVEKVDAQPLDGNSLDSIYFQQRSVTPLPFTVENEVATVNFQGLPGEAYYLSALKDSGADSLVDHVVGLLSVVPYEQLTPRIVLVPLSSSAANGVLASEIEQELQRIYAQAVVRPSVTLDAVFSPAGYTPPLRAVASGLLSNYTPQMNDLISAYEDQPGYDPNAYDSAP